MEGPTFLQNTKAQTPPSKRQFPCAGIALTSQGLGRETKSSKARTLLKIEETGLDPFERAKGAILAMLDANIRNSQSKVQKSKQRDRAEHVVNMCDNMF